MNFLIIFVFAFALTSAQETKLVDQGVYKIDNQNDKAFLTALASLGKSGEISGLLGQKWTFILADPAQKHWAIQSTKDESILGDGLWLVTYQGYGRYQLKNAESQKCLRSNGKGKKNAEDDCKYTSTQRWGIKPTTR